MAHEVSVGVSSAWKRVGPWWIGSSSAWKKILRGHVGISGAWKQFYEDIPANMIALFAAAAPSPWNALSYTTCYPWPSDTVGSSYYFSMTHTHGSVTAVFANCGTTDADDAIIRYNRMAQHGASHNYAHSHGAEDHQPLYQEWRGASANGARSIPTSAILFFNGTSIPSGWKRATYTDGRYVRMNSSGAGGTGGNLSHYGHSHADSAYDAAIVARQGGTSITQPVAANHNHTVPNHNAKLNDPLYINLDAISPDTNPAYSIPSGVVAFFLGSTVPAGWSVYSAALGRFIKVTSSSIEGTGGNVQHEHAEGYLTSGTYAGSTGVGGLDGEPCATPSHAHIVTHTHSADYGNTMPLAYPFLICRKD